MPTFYRVMMSIARGCPSTGWMACLGSGHALQVASYWPEEAQAELFGDGHFVASASFAAQDAIARPVARRLPRQRHVALLLGRSLRDAPHRPRPAARRRRRARGGDPAQGLHRPGRLGRPHRAEGQRVAQRPRRGRARPRAPRDHVRGVRRVRRHHDPGLRAARQPAVRRRVRAVRDGRAELRPGRQRAGRGRRVRADHHRAPDVDAQRRRRSHPRGEQGLPALPRAGDRLHGRRVLDRRALRRALHGARRAWRWRRTSRSTRSAGSGSTGSS